MNATPAIPPHVRPAPQLFGWGANDFNQLGKLASSNGVPTPKQHPWVNEQMPLGTFGEPGAGLESIAAGGMHTLLIDEKGTVWSCGVNDDAGLGRFTENVPDPADPGEILDEDELCSELRPLQSLVDEGFRAVQIVAGDSISAAVNDTGELRVWGTFRYDDGDRRFSSSSSREHQFEPVSLALPGPGRSVGKVSFLASGSNHLLVLTTGGHVFTWGTNGQNQLGRRILSRHRQFSTTPEKVVLGNRTRKAVVIGAGNHHSVAVDQQGDVWAWGLNNYGQCGIEPDSLSGDDLVISQPRKVESLSPNRLGGGHVVAIAGGMHHALFLISDGHVYACGRSDGGQLGNGEPDEASERQPFCSAPMLVPIPNDSNHPDPVITIAAGIHSNMALTASGALFAWGQGLVGELGIRGKEVLWTPTAVLGRENPRWRAVAVSCGGQHTLGLFCRRE